MRLKGRVPLGFVLRRLVWAVPVLLAVVVVSFMVLRFTPGGPFDREKPLPDAIRANLRAQYRLDRPMLPVYVRPDPEARDKEAVARRAELARFEASYTVVGAGPVRVVLSPSGVAETQLLAYLGQLARGDLGVSMKFTQVRINAILGRTFPVSLTLGLIAFAMSLTLGVGLGLLAAWRRGSWLDAGAMVVATLGFSMPSFVLGAGLIFVFALVFKLLPPALWEGPSYVVLPALTLAVGPASYIARLTRSGVLEAMDHDYIRTARAKGLRERVVLIKHGLGNALGPLITVTGPLLAMLVTGSFIVEHIFAIPGMGRYFITAVIDRDYPLVMGVTVVYAALIVLANLAVDVAYAVADPRVKL